jgi:hypothetical protein
VHRGDDILFYLERPAHDSKREGGHFFGIFECASEAPFFEPAGDYLRDELGMSIGYRLMICPRHVYSRGLTEWHMMDEMGQFRDVHDVPWTLIYRKMTAGRGCTPLLPHEADAIRRMLDLRNGGQQLEPRGVGFSSGLLALIDGAESTPYGGRTDEVPDIRERLTGLFGTSRKCELHLQAYLMQELGRNADLTSLFFPNVDLKWIGNEIYCGAGMQKIDLLAYTSNDAGNRFVHLFELKDGAADESAAAQLNRYVKWLRAHIPGIVPQQIIPTIVSREATDGFHSELRTCLRGHGIEAYREIRYTDELEFQPTIQQF